MQEQWAQWMHDKQRSFSPSRRVFGSETVRIFGAFALSFFGDLATPVNRKFASPDLGRHFWRCVGFRCTVLDIASHCVENG